MTALFSFGNFRTTPDLATIYANKKQWSLSRLVQYRSTTFEENCSIIRLHRSSVLSDYKWTEYLARASSWNILDLKFLPWSDVVLMHSKAALEIIDEDYNRGLPIDFYCISFWPLAEVIYSLWVVLIFVYCCWTLDGDVGYTLEVLFLYILPTIYSVESFMCFCQSCLLQVRARCSSMHLLQHQWYVFLEHYR